MSPDRDEVLEGRPEVVVLVLEPVEEAARGPRPRRWCRAPAVLGGRRRTRGTPLRGGPAARSSRPAPRASRARTRGWSRASSNRVSPWGSSPIPQQALLGEALEAAEHVQRRLVAGDPAHGLRGLDRPAAREHARAARTAGGPPGRAGRGSSRSHRAASAAAPAGRAPPDDNSPSRSPSRCAIAAGESSRIRAAASSIASGRPSRRRTISATACPFAAVSMKSGRTAIARSTNSRTASASMRSATSVTPAAGSESGGTGNSCSPEIRSGARLETITVSLGAERRRSATTGAPATTCSKLSRTSSAWRSRRCSLTRSIGGRCGASRPSEPAIADATRSASVTGASGTNQVPSGYRSTQSPARASDSRVLPVPPGPVSVRRRVRSRSATALSTSRRPTKVVSCGGRLLGVRSRVRSAGNVVSRAAASTWYSRSGRAKSLSRCSPRSRRVMPAPGSPATDRVASVTMTWPPCAAAPTRAARWTSMPT